MLQRMVQGERRNAHGRGSGDVLVCKGIGSGLWLRNTQHEGRHAGYETGQSGIDNQEITHLYCGHSCCVLWCMRSDVMFEGERCRMLTENGFIEPEVA